MPATEYVKIGIKAALYRNTAAWDTPAWVLVDCVGDIQLPLARSRAKVVTRASIVERGKNTTMVTGVTGKMISSDTDPNYLAFLNAFYADTPLDLLVLNGALTDANAQGVRMHYDVVKFDEAQPTGDVVMRDFALEPSLTDKLPQKATIPDPAGTVAVPIITLTNI